MKENNGGNSATKKKKLIYSLVVAICVLLLAAATVLTVYFLTAGDEFVLENPSDEPSVPSDPVDEPIEEPSEPSGGEIDPEPSEPTEPSGGGDVVTFLSPIENAVCTVEHQAIYTNATLNTIRRHMGVDFAAEEGTAVLAIGAGTVTSVSYSAELGNVITIDHGDGLKSAYRFVEPVDGLDEGDHVEKGEQIATVAAAYGTEYKDGAHLHFELTLNEDYVDPADYFDITYEEK